MIGASPSSGLVAIQCAPGSGPGRGQHCAANGRIAVSSTPCCITRAIKRPSTTQNLSFGGPALHHVHMDHVICTMVQAQSTKSLARRHGANGHRDAYMVRCGHFQRPPPPSSASAFSQDQGQHGIRQNTGKKGRQQRQRNQPEQEHHQDTRTSRGKAVQDDDDKDRRRQVRTPNNGEGPAADQQQQEKKSRLAAFGAEGTASRSKTVRRSMAGVGLADSAQQGPPRCSCTSGLGTPIRQELLDGVWSVGCVSHRLGVGSRSKSDGAVALPSTRGPCWGSIDSRTVKGKGLFGSWRDWRRVFARS